MDRAMLPQPGAAMSEEQKSYWIHGYQTMDAENRKIIADVVSKAAALLFHPAPPLQFGQLPTPETPEIAAQKEAARRTIEHYAPELAAVLGAGGQQTSPGAEPPLTPEEQAELERLRALKAQQAK
jgi:hypothetical protein